MSNARTALLFVFVTTLGLLLWQWSALPTEVASHFDLEGRSDRTTSRGTLLAIFAMVTTLETLLFLALPAFVRRASPDSISLPNRDHWLAPERRDDTLTEIGARLTWLGVCTGLFFLLLVWETGRANLTRGADGVATLGPVFWIALILLGLSLVAWTRSFVSRFRSVPVSSGA